MDEQIKKILDSPLSSPKQKAKAQAALTGYESSKSGGFTTLIGTHSVCLGTTFENLHYQIVVESGYADGLLQTRSMDQAAKQACNDRLLGGLRAKYDEAENETFQKRFPKDCYQVLRIEKGTK